jgi:hypothetical protein
MGIVVQSLMFDIYVIFMWMILWLPFVHWTRFNFSLNVLFVRFALDFGVLIRDFLGELF